MRPASKPSDMYNYRVAAYLKTSATDMHIPGPALRNLDFTVIPKSIPKENTFLNVEIIFDAIISGSENEYLCECKYHQEPRPLTVKSIEVKDSMLEFIAAEKYRIGHIKRDGIFYLLITNCPINRLNKDLDTLRTADDEETIQYSEALRKRAKEKWSSFNPNVEIKVEWIRNVLMRIVPVEINDGRLSEASKNPAYEQELRKIMDQISRINPALVPLEYRVRNTIRFIIGKGDEKTVGFLKGGYFLEISTTIVNQILSYNRIFNKPFVKTTPNEIPFVQSCEILHHSSISPENSMELIIEALNDLVEQHFGKIEFFVVINPGTYDVYYADLEWFYALITNCVNARGFYIMAEIAKRLPISVSKFVLTSLVRETMRLGARIIVREDVMDFLGIEERDDLLQQ